MSISWQGINLFIMAEIKLFNTIIISKNGNIHWAHGKSPARGFYSSKMAPVNLSRDSWRHVKRVYSLDQYHNLLANTLSNSHTLLSLLGKSSKFKSLTAVTSAHKYSNLLGSKFALILKWICWISNNVSSFFISHNARQIIFTIMFPTIWTSWMGF